jgi:hypothetical protein
VDPAHIPHALLLLAIPLAYLCKWADDRKSRNARVKERLDLFQKRFERGWR